MPVSPFSPALPDSTKRSAIGACVCMKFCNSPYYGPLLCSAQPLECPRLTPFLDNFLPEGSVNPWGPAGTVLMLSFWAMQVLWHQDRADHRSCGAPVQGREVGVGELGDRLHQVQRQEGQQKPQAARVEPEAEAQGAVTIPAGHPAWD